MAFRDDLEAAHARGDALERRVAELEAENRELRGGGEEPESGELAPIELERAATRLATIAGALVVAAAIGLISVGVLEVGIAVAALGLVLLAAAVILSQVLYVVPPNAAAVISGRKRRGPDGALVNYRIVIGGRVVLIPIIERIDAIDLGVQWFEVQVSTYARGGKEVNARIRGAFNIAGRPPLIDNAIERFLGRSMGEVKRVVRETFEGHIRGVFAQLTIDELRGDPEKLAVELIGESEHDLEKLGVELDDLTVVRVGPS